MKIQYLPESCAKTGLESWGPQEGVAAGEEQPPAWLTLVRARSLVWALLLLLTACLCEVPPLSVPPSSAAELAGLWELDLLLLPRPSFCWQVQWEGLLAAQLHRLTWEASSTHWEALQLLEWQLLAHRLPWPLSLCFCLHH